LWIDVTILLLNLVSAATGLATVLQHKLPAPAGGSGFAFLTPYLAVSGAIIGMQVLFTLAVRDVTQLEASAEHMGKAWVHAMANAFQCLRMGMAVTVVFLWAAVPLMLVSGTGWLAFGIAGAVVACLIGVISVYAYQQWKANRIYQQWTRASLRSAHQREEPGVGQVLFRDDNDARFLAIRDNPPGVRCNTAHPRLKLYLGLSVAIVLLLITGLASSRRA
jgi:hypothetical protein